MKDKKKEPIKSHPAFDKLMGFTDKLDGGGTHMDKEEMKEGLLDDLKNFFNKKERSSNEITPEEIKRFTCTDCGNYDYDMYMVSDDIWNKYGNQTNTLCMDCLQKRMGRKLTKKDFSGYEDTPVNIHNNEVQEIIDNYLNR